MFVGATGIARVLQGTCEAMVREKTGDPAKVRALGVIDLPTIQRYLNLPLRRHARLVQGQRLAECGHVRRQWPY